MPEDIEPTVSNPNESPETAKFRAGNVVDLAIERELQDSYLTYAMSTIMDRALPDVRDGLKPSQRRILVAMNDLKLGPGRKHMKCAKICGDTSGNYHPHGESVVYPTLVGMAQPWKMRAPLVDSQGNFGSIDGDPPAAMRYTEARLAAPAMEMLDDLHPEIVEFKPNYDERLEEPTVLPAKFPNLLVNGGTGIAVGMATNLPPHNVGEICDAIITQIDNPGITLQELMDIVPGPDFPTGGTICGRHGIYKGYATGLGRIAVRAKTHFEEQKNGKTLIVVDEIPYQILKTTIIDRIVDLVKNDRIKDIADINDFSGRQGMRLVIECKKGADANVVLNQLWQYSPLQRTYSIMNIALVNGQPKTMGLKELIQHFIDHRVDVIRARTAYKLQQAQQDAHRREGLIYAICDIDEVIRLIRSSRTRDEAIDKLMARGFKIPDDHPYAPQIPQRLLNAAKESPEGMVKLSKAQAEAIGRMSLISLVGLEIERIVAEYSKLVEEIEGYEAILADHQLVLDIIREDTHEMKDKYAKPRMTDIEEAADDIQIADLIPEEDVLVTISHNGYVKRLPLDEYRVQARGGKGVIGAGKDEEDFTEQIFVASTHDDLLCFTDSGRVFKKKVYEIPQASKTSKGRAIVNLLELKDDESICRFLPVKNFEKHGDFLVFATSHGLVKRTSLKLYQNVNRGGIIAVGLKDGDRLVNVTLTSGEDHLLLCTSNGIAIRFSEQDVRAMGRSAAGVKGVKLGEENRVVALCRADDEQQLLTICANGYGKRTPMREYLVQMEDGSTRAQSRGGKGRVDIKVDDRNGPVVAALPVVEDDQVMLITQRGLIVRTSVSEIRQTGRGTKGVRVIRLNDGDTLNAVARVDDSSAKPEGLEDDQDPVDGEATPEAVSDEQTPVEAGEASISADESTEGTSTEDESNDSGDAAEGTDA